MLRVPIQHGRFIEMKQQEADILLGIVRSDAFLNISIPLNPNPRSFTGKRNQNYMRMLRTILNEPQLFFHKNASGITVFVEDYEMHDDGSVTLIMDEKRDGVGNGAHTLAVLSNLGTEKGYVKMQVVKGLPEGHLVDVVESLNLSKRIEQYSLENKRGSFDWHKESLGDLSEGVRYHEGDSGLTDVREEMGALHAYLYAKDGEKRPLVAYRGSVNVNHQALVKLRQDRYARQVEGIVAEVHRLHRFIITNQHFIALCDISHVKGWKRRLLNNEHGIIRAVANLVHLGLSVVGTKLDEDGVVQWRKGFNTHHLRCQFASQLFTKIFDILVLEDGTLSAASRRQSVIERVVKQAEILAARQGSHIQLELV